jgi:hypothetical protein
MTTNPVVVRRVMGGLREQGYVRSEKGHGGGWEIACDFNEVTLRDIYEALGEPVLLAMGNRTEMPGCLVEQAVNASLDKAFADRRKTASGTFWRGNARHAERGFSSTRAGARRNIRSGEQSCIMMQSSSAAASPACLRQPIWRAADDPSV